MVIRSLGSNGRPTPALLTKKEPKHKRNWLDNVISNCGGARDEYPYASVYEGGKENYYKGSVSLRCVSKDESGLQGGFNSSFYRGAQIGVGDMFLVIPLGGQTGYFDKRGIYHRYVPRRYR